MPSTLPSMLPANVWRVVYGLLQDPGDRQRFRAVSKMMIHITARQQIPRTLFAYRPGLLAVAEEIGQGYQFQALEISIDDESEPLLMTFRTLLSLRSLQLDNCQGLENTNPPLRLHWAPRNLEQMRLSLCPADGDYPDIDFRDFHRFHKLIALEVVCWPCDCTVKLLECACLQSLPSLQKLRLEFVHFQDYVVLPAQLTELIMVCCDSDSECDIRSATSHSLSTYTCLPQSKS